MPSLWAGRVSRDQALERLVGLLGKIGVEARDLLRLSYELLIGCLCVFALKRHDIAGRLEAGELRHEFRAILKRLLGIVGIGSRDRLNACGNGFGRRYRCIALLVGLLLQLLDVTHLEILCGSIGGFGVDCLDATCRNKASSLNSPLIHLPMVKTAQSARACASCPLSDGSPFLDMLLRFVLPALHLFLTGDHQLLVIEADLMFLSFTPASAPASMPGEAGILAESTKRILKRRGNCALTTARKNETNAYLTGWIGMPEPVSEVDPMSAILPLSLHRRVGRQWAARINAMRKINGQIVAATERALQRLFGNEGALVPIPVRASVRPRRPDPSRSHD